MQHNHALQDAASTLLAISAERKAETSDSRSAASSEVNLSPLKNSVNHSSDDSSLSNESILTEVLKKEIRNVYNKATSYTDEFVNKMYLRVRASLYSAKDGMDKHTEGLIMHKKAIEENQTLIKSVMHKNYVATHPAVKAIETDLKGFKTKVQQLNQGQFTFASSLKEQLDNCKDAIETKKRRIDELCTVTNDMMFTIKKQKAEIDMLKRCILLGVGSKTSLINRDPNMTARVREQLYKQSNHEQTPRKLGSVLMGGAMEKLTKLREEPNKSEDPNKSAGANNTTIGVPEKKVLWKPPRSLTTTFIDRNSLPLKKRLLQNMSEGVD